MFGGKKNYLQELKSFELGDMPLNLPKGALILRIVLVSCTLLVAGLLFYYVISTLFMVSQTFSPEVLGGRLGLP